MLKDFFKTTAFDLWGDLMIARKKRKEIRAFRDPRRVAIAREFPLSREQKEQVDSFFMLNYGQKVDYVWHQNFAAHSGHFDYRYFPGILYISEFEAFANQKKDFITACGDKNFIGLIANSVGIRMPRTIVSCTNGVLRDNNDSLITQEKAKELIHQCERGFFKPTVNSSSGKGCRIISGDDLVLLTRNTLALRNGNEVIGHNDFIIQECLKCHESIRKLYDGSVNTFRVTSYLWKGQVELMPVIIRIGQGGHYLDNAHQGGVFCAIYEDGSMGKMAMTEFNDHYLEHPDTHVRFELHRISHVDRVLDAAKRLHSAIPQLGVVNWDFTIDDCGEPVLIEANCKNGGIWVSQMAHGVGAFGERTAEVLKWLRFMKKLKPHERIHYVGGYTD